MKLELKTRLITLAAGMVLALAEIALASAFATGNAHANDADTDDCVQCVSAAAPGHGQP